MKIFSSQKERRKIMHGKKSTPLPTEDSEVQEVLREYQFRTSQYFGTGNNATCLHFKITKTHKE
jgi:hypothetical protein